MKNSLTFIVFSCIIALQAATYTEVLKSDKSSAFERRRAYRQWVASQEKMKALEAGLHDKDAAIRKYAVAELFQNKKDFTDAELKSLIKEPDPVTGEFIVECLNSMKDRKRSFKWLSLMAKENPCEATCKRAHQISNFPFYRENKRLKDEKTLDHLLVIDYAYTIPDTNWKIQKDPKEILQHQGVFKENYNDVKWIKTGCGVWEEKGLGKYDGYAWYRIRFTMPKKLNCDAVELHFQAVDESAWVWLNGIYLGCHDIGIRGWNIPFWLDCTREFRWDGENLLVVRVRDRGNDGGIYKPVVVECLRRTITN